MFNKNNTKSALELLESSKKKKRFHLWALLPLSSYALATCVLLVANTWNEPGILKDVKVIDEAVWAKHGNGVFDIPSEQSFSKGKDIFVNFSRFPNVEEITTRAIGVTIPSSNSHILKGLYFSDTLKKVGDNFISALVYTRALKARGLEEIGDNAFRFNLNSANGDVNGFKTEIDTPNLVKIGNNAFSPFIFDIQTLTYKRLKTVGDGNFGNISENANLNFPLLETVGNNSFNSRSGFDGSAINVDMTSLKTVGNESFKNSNLVNGSFPNLESVGDNSMLNTTFNAYDFPKLTHIGDNSFKVNLGNSNLINSTLISIGNRTFSECTLTRIEIPNATNISSNAFASSPVTYIDISNATEIGDNAFGSVVNSNSTTVKLHSSLNSTSAKNRIFGSGNHTNINFEIVGGAKW